MASAQLVRAWAGVDDSPGNPARAGVEAMASARVPPISRADVTRLIQGVPFGTPCGARGLAPVSDRDPHPDHGHDRIDGQHEVDPGHGRTIDTTGARRSTRSTAGAKMAHIAEASAGVSSTSFTRHIKP